MERRNFLKIAGAATVATALPGCTPKEPKSLIPYIIPDEEIIPGRSVLYATVCRECPAGCGMNIRVREGRATKAEGNPLHPVNKGALCARGQASLQGLYNPDRIQTPLRKNDAGSWEKISWDQAHDMVLERLKDIVKQGNGKYVSWISGHTTGTLDTLIADWLSLVGSTKHYHYEPFNHEALREANAQVFGISEIPRYDLTNAGVVISFGADLLETWLSPVEFAGQLAHGRGVGEKERTRFVYIGPRLSMTATNADVWLNVSPEAMASLALSLVYVMLQDTPASVNKLDAARIRQIVEHFAPSRIASSLGLTVEEITELGKSLAASRSAVAVAGGLLLENDNGVKVAAAVNLLNYVSGSIGKNVDFGASSTQSRLSSYGDMLELMGSMEQGRIPLLILDEVNPVFTLTGGERFAAALRKVPFVVATASFMDETASMASIIMPTHTPLESWGDFEPYRGVHGLLQPVMEPVFGTKMLGDILLETGNKLSGGWKNHADSFAIYLKEQWKGLHKKIGGSLPFETFWTESLARGGVWEKAESRKVQLTRNITASFFEPEGPEHKPEASSSSLIVYPSFAHFDGRGANKPWLQELPDPMTRLVWGTWVEINPDDAARLGVREGDAVSIVTSHGEIEAGAYITSGIRKGSVAVPIGQGHTAFGRYATGLGANAVRLLEGSPSTSGLARWYGASAEIRKGTAKRFFASVQEAATEHHREIIQVVPVSELSNTPAGEQREAPSIYPRDSYAKHHWGMSVDLDKCTGCGACVTACYAENNIPVVGIDEVSRGREMAWLRVDRYYDEELLVEGKTRARFIPMFCQQCGAAPCETVCPVYAAYHTEEGLNGQVYNRCIGTRYCANNCPYKVRRFNWFGHEWPSPLNWQLNPDVTVRTKGVMEKCTFCVQRIVEAKNNARMEHRQIREGEIRTACQQTCPSQAIMFGDLKEEESNVTSRAHDKRRAYHVLEELNTTPAVTYQKRISEIKGS